MRVMTLGASWVKGAGSSNPETTSWPAQMASAYDIEVNNLGMSGAGNSRICRVAIEELSRDPDYDYVIVCLAPAIRTEILNNGKWHQIWPGKTGTHLDKVYADMWMPWNDVQNVILLSFYFIHSIKALGIPLYMEGCGLNFKQYQQELTWIMDYKNDNDFNSLGMPLNDLNIGIKDLDRKLKSLKSMHLRNINLQPAYLSDSADILNRPEIGEKYGEILISEDKHHPNDAGYAALADYFASKIGLTK